MTGMTCEQARERLSDHLERTLPDRESAALSAHIGRCPACAAEADGLKETMALLRELPPRKAPPELMGRIAAAVERERPRRSLWRVLFLPVHVKIPLEAAAAAVLFVLVFGLPGGEPRREPVPEPPARVAGAPPAPSSAEPARTARAAAPRRTSKDSRSPEREKKAAEAPPPVPEKESARGSVMERESRPLLRVPAPPEGLPPAMFASTEGKRVDMAVGGPEEPLGKAGAPAMGAAPHVFAAPPSRVGRPLPYGREVVLEVRGEDAAAAEERIAGAAVRLGGTHRREPSGPAVARLAAPAAPPVVRVDLPSARAEEFLGALQAIGTIPDGGFPARVDIPAGPSPDVAAFTVRVRVK